jgi:hypothetical protein
VKFICFGYLDVETWGKEPANTQHAMVDECLAYDDVLKKNGHWVGGEGLQNPDKAATLRYQNGKVSVTDGPYAETKEVLGGFLILEASDRNEAIQLMSKHPGTKMGPWEIRPVEDMTEMIRESERRRSAWPRAPRREILDPLK